MARLAIVLCAVLFASAAKSDKAPNAVEFLNQLAAGTKTTITTLKSKIGTDITEIEGNQSNKTDLSFSVAISAVNKMWEELKTLTNQTNVTIRDLANTTGSTIDIAQCIDKIGKLEPLMESTSSAVGDCIQEKSKSGKKKTDDEISALKTDLTELDKIVVDIDRVKVHTGSVKSILDATKAVRALAAKVTIISTPVRDTIYAPEKELREQVKDCLKEYERFAKESKTLIKECTGDKTL